MTGHPTDPPGADTADERAREWADDSETEAAADAEQAPASEAGTYLVVRSPDRVSIVDLAHDGEWIVGRGSEADIVLDDKQVSRKHARVRFIAGVLSVDDLGSRNGTTVGGRQLRSATLCVGPGDVIELGDSCLVVATRAARDHVTGEPTIDAGPASTSASGEMAGVYASARKVARMPTTVLILGETGVGKDVLAQRIHAWSTRAERAFVRINCAGLPDTLLESELFGYERGAFTGAERRKPGYFEVAEGGTVFLDEIGELSANAQVKLLNVLETRTVTRLGGTAPIPVDVRVLCATHRDLRTFVDEGRFRADLFYRISPFTLRIPPLRERRGEIAELGATFVGQLAAQLGAPSPALSPRALALLAGYEWPGNVRELRNAIEHAFVMSEGTTLEPEHFAPEIRGRATANPSVAPKGAAPLRKTLADIQRTRIEEALAAEGGNQTRAAARLGMSRRTLVYRLAQYRRADEEQAPEPENEG